MAYESALAQPAQVFVGPVSLLLGVNRLKVVLSVCLANEPHVRNLTRCEGLLEKQAAVCAGLQTCSGIRRDKANTADQC